MDDQNINNTNPTQPDTSAPYTQDNTAQPSMDSTQPGMTPPTAQPTAEGTVVYATFVQRLLAAIIDSVILGFASGIISFPIAFIAATGGDNSIGALMSLVSNLLSFVLYAAYYAGLTSTKGGTLGKMALGLRVQNQATGANLTMVEALLREVVGKFVSGMLLGLGYLWMLWDPNKQCLHDKIAHSVVVKNA